MPEKVAVITGASDGIGKQAAMALSAAGWHVVIIGRNPQRTRALGQALGMPCYIADFSNLQEVAVLADQLITDCPRIDVLLNNAGGMFPRGEKTRDGHETTFQVNHLAHFLLTRLLMGRLLESQASVINTSSIAHRLLGFLYRPGRPEEAFLHSMHLAYGNAKLANILFTRELHLRYHRQGLKAAAVHPGVVATSFSSNTHSPMRLLYGSALARLPGIKSSAQGAMTLVRLAKGTPGKDWAPGAYYSGFRQVTPSRKARASAAGRLLWEYSEKALENYL